MKNITRSIAVLLLTMCGACTAYTGAAVDVSASPLDDCTAGQAPGCNGSQSLTCRHAHEAPPAAGCGEMIPGGVNWCCSKPVQPAPLSCNVVSDGEKTRVVKFSDVETAAPDGVRCTSLGGGYFECPADFCVVSPYAGTCPHCGGGGE